MAPRPRDPKTLLDELLRVLGEQGFARVPRERLKVRQLLGLRRAWPAQELADALAALLATNPAELTKLRATSLALLEEPDETPQPPAKPDPEALSAGAWARWWSWKGGLATAFGLGVLALLGLLFLPRPRVESDCAEPGTCSLVTGETRTFRVLDNDVTPALGARTAALVELPQLGQATLEADGSVTFTAGPQAGRDRFVYELGHWSGTARGVVEIEVRAPPPPEPEPKVVSPPPQPSERTRVYSHVPRFAGEPAFLPNTWPPLAPLLWPPGISAGALALYLLYLRWARRRRGKDPLAWDPLAPERFRPSRIGGEPSSWLAPRDLDQLAEIPIYLETDEPSERLDLAATVAGSARELLPDLHFERRRERLRVFLLVDDDAAALAWNPLPTELAHGLEMRGLEVEVARFLGTLKRLHGRGDENLSLSTLEPEKDHLLVLVVSDGAGLSADDEPLLTQLAGFPRLAWLDPREPRFWDESTEIVESFGLPQFPANREGAGAAFDALLSPRGGQRSPYSMAELRRRGLLVRRREGLRAQVEEILGDALPWAQSCAMIQPVTVGLAQRLRERFYPALPAMALGRLFALPGTRVTTAGLSFADPVLALLRSGFTQTHERTKEADVLELILDELREVRPQQHEERPGLALLAWTATYERVRLEVDPDDAARKLERLATTPLGPAVRAELARLERPWREGDSATGEVIPLRIEPQTGEAKNILDELARRVSAGQPEPRRLKALEGAGLVLLTTALLVCLWPLAKAWRETGTKQQVTWVLRSHLGGSSAAASRISVGFAVDAQRFGVAWPIVRGDGETAMSSTEQLRSEESARLVLLGPATTEAMPWARPDSRGGRVEVPVTLGSLEQECATEQALLGLTTQHCPDGAAGTALPGRIELPSWRQKLGDRAPANRLLSLGIEVSPDASQLSGSQPLRDAMLASSTVDRLYRVDASKSLLGEALQEIGASVRPFGTYVQVLWWVRGEGEATEALAESVSSLLVADPVLRQAVTVRVGADGRFDPAKTSFPEDSSPPFPQEAIAVALDLEHELRQARILAQNPILALLGDTRLASLRETRVLSIFPPGSQTLSTWSQAVLTNLGAQLAQQPGLSVVVAGHHGNQGPAKAGSLASEGLATLVRERLTQELGIDPNRVSTTTRYISDLPLSPDEDVVYLFTGPPQTVPPPPPSERTFTILATSDLAQTPAGPREALDRGGFARFRALRRQLERRGENVLVLHAGGAVRTSGFGVVPELELERGIDLLNLLDGSSSRRDPNLVVGYGLPEISTVMFQNDAGMKDLSRVFAQSQFQWLVDGGASLSLAANHPQLADTVIRTPGEVKVGILYLEPVAIRILGVRPDTEQKTVRDQVGRLRQAGADFVVAMSYRPIDDDSTLLEALGDDGPDLIVGGGESSQQVVARGGRFVVKASSARDEAAVIRIRLRSAEKPVVEPRVVTLAPVQSAADLDAGVRLWRERVDQAFCEAHGGSPNCLDEVLAMTTMPLDLTQRSLRGGESPFGDWVADRMRAAFPKVQADVAFLNSGALRLDRTLAAGEKITRRDLEELVPFSSSLKLLEISGAALRQAIEHSVGLPEQSGGWLQVSGLAFRYERDRPEKPEIFVLEEAIDEGSKPAQSASYRRLRPLRDEETLRVVTPGFLVELENGNQDGYTMLNPKQAIESGMELKDLIENALRNSPGLVISPIPEGRICLVGSGGPCLLDEPAAAAAE